MSISVTWFRNYFTLIMKSFVHTRVTNESMVMFSVLHHRAKRALSSYDSYFQDLIVFGASVLMKEGISQNSLSSHRTFRPLVNLDYGVIN